VRSMSWKRFKIISDWLQNGWSLAVLLFPSAGAAVSGWSAYFAHEPWHKILFWSTSVFCFLILSISKLSSWLRETAISEKIKLGAFRILIGKSDNAPDFVAQCELKLLNKSVFNLYYKIDEAELILAGKGAIHRTIETAIMIIQAQSDTVISFATIDGIKAEPMDGRMILKLKYGKTKDILDHEFKLVAEPRIAVILNEKGEFLGSASNYAIKEVSYI
jgi:hypothetical protein